MKIIKTALFLAAGLITAFNSFAFDAPNEKITLNEFVKLASVEFKRNIITTPELEEENVFIFGVSNLSDVKKVYKAVLKANRLKEEAVENVFIISKNNEVKYDYVIRTYKLNKKSEKIASNLDSEFEWVEEQYGTQCKFSLDDEVTLNVMCASEVMPLIQERLMFSIGQRKQVLIKAHMIETTNANFVGIGMKYGLETKNGGITYNLNKGILNSAMEKLELALSLGDFDAFMQLSESENNIKTVSRPSILIESGNTGSINTVSQIPVATSIEDDDEEDEIKTNIEYVDVGVKLDILTEVEGDDITLTITGELSSVDDLSGGLNPTFKKSQIKTKATIKEGELINLGGVITTQKVYEKSGIPILNKLPITEWIFGWENEREDNKELSIMLTAIIK